ncbi:MAG: hypothetical protein ACI94O_000421 [Octadecabacter sp.]|jgi:hypothetical protein
MYLDLRNLLIVVTRRKTLTKTVCHNASLFRRSFGSHTWLRAATMRDPDTLRIEPLRCAP